MQFVYKYFLAIVLILHAFSGNAQDNKPWFFQDGGISKTRFILKTDPLAMTGGCYPAFLEYRYARYFAIEGGIGYLNKNFKYFFPLNNIFNDEANYTPNHGGYYLSLENKFGASYRNYCFYASLGIKYRHFDDLSTKEYFTGVGAQWFIANRFTLDTEVEMGLMTQHSIDKKIYVSSDFAKFIPFLLIELKLGYKF